MPTVPRSTPHVHSNLEYDWGIPYQDGHCAGAKLDHCRPSPTRTRPERISLDICSPYFFFFFSFFDDGQFLLTVPIGDITRFGWNRFQGEGVGPFVQGWILVRHITADQSDVHPRMRFVVFLRNARRIPLLPCCEAFPNRGNPSWRRRQQCEQ